MTSLSLSFCIIGSTFIHLIQFSPVTQLCLTLCDSMNRSTSGLPVHYQHPEFIQIHIHRVSDVSQPSHPLSSPSSPAPIPPSIRVFSSESTLRMRWPKYWSFSFSNTTYSHLHTLFWGGSKITEDGDCSHEIKRRLLLGRKVMTNLDSILKSRGITLPTKVRLGKAMVFPVVMYGCESWTVKKAEC